MELSSNFRRRADVSRRQHRIYHRFVPGVCCWPISVPAVAQLQIPEWRRSGAPVAIGLCSRVTREQTSLGAVLTHRLPGPIERSHNMGQIAHAREVWGREASHLVVPPW